MMPLMHFVSDLKLALRLQNFSEHLQTFLLLSYSLFQKSKVLASLLVHPRHRAWINGLFPFYFFFFFCCHSVCSLLLDFAFILFFSSVTILNIFFRVHELCMLNYYFSALYHFQIMHNFYAVQLYRLDTADSFPKLSRAKEGRHIKLISGRQLQALEIKNTESVKEKESPKSAVCSTNASRAMFHWCSQLSVLSWRLWISVCLLRLCNWDWEVYLLGEVAWIASASLALFSFIIIYYDFVEHLSWYFHCRNTTTVSFHIMFKSIWNTWAKYLWGFFKEPSRIMIMKKKKDYIYFISGLILCLPYLGEMRRPKPSLV